MRSRIVNGEPRNSTAELGHGQEEKTAAGLVVDLAAKEVQEVMLH